jgi:hypothetical protein
MTAITTTHPATASTQSAPVASRTARARPSRRTPGTAEPNQQHPPTPSGPLPAWPAGPLDAAEHAFDLLIGPPTPLVFDGRGVAGLPQRTIVLDELRHLLLATSTRYPHHPPLLATLPGPTSFTVPAVIGPEEDPLIAVTAVTSTTASRTSPCRKWPITSAFTSAPPEPGAMSH